MDQHETPEVLVTRGKLAAYGIPTDDELEAINAHARVGLQSEDLYVIEMVPSSTTLDSHYTRMDAATTLRNYARDAARGVPMMNSHARFELPIGRTFTGKYVTGNLKTVRGHVLSGSKEEPLVFAAGYLPRDLATSTAANREIIRAIETGVAQDVSVGFGGENLWYRCDVCNSDLITECTEHWPGMKVGGDDKKWKGKRATATVMDAVLNEISPVWRGSNPTAVMLRALAEKVERGALSHAEVLELDQVTGQRMASHIDWQELASRKRTFMMTTNATDGGMRNTLEEAFSDGHSTDPEQTAAGERSDNPSASAESNTPPVLGDASSRTEHPFLGVLRAASVTDEAALRALVQQAEDGKRYREDLVELCHRAGVRAMGEEYRREVHERYLSSMGVKDLQEILAGFNAAARKRFAKHPPQSELPGQGGDSQSRVAQEVGGRQTVAGNGPLGTVPNENGNSATDFRRSSDDLFKFGER